MWPGTEPWSLGPLFLTYSSYIQSEKQNLEGVPVGVLAKVFDCNLELRKFEIQLFYHIHFLTNTLWKGMNPLIPLAMG